MKSGDRGLDLLWGAAAIGRELNVSRNQAFHMLEAGYVRSAKKVGGRWVVDRRKLHDEFTVHTLAPALQAEA